MKSRQMLGFLLSVGMGLGALAGAQEKRPKPQTKAGTKELSEREQRLAARRDSKLNEEIAAVFRSADTTYLVGDVGRAAELFGKVLTMAPASNYSVRALARLGDCSYEMKKYDAAAAHYRRAVAGMEDVTDPEEVAAGIRADFMVGRSYLAAKNYTACFGAFRKFIDRHPQHALANVAYQSIGDAHLALEQYQQALAAYRMVGTVVAEKTTAHKRITPGNRLYLKVIDADVNVGETPRGVKAIVKTSAGDMETVELEPMGLRNPVFLGTIATALASPRHSGDLDKAFTEETAIKIRTMLADAEKMAALARSKQQEAVEIDRSAEKTSNPAGAEKKRAALVADAEQLNSRSKSTIEEACKQVDASYAALEKILADWAPGQSVKMLTKARIAATRATTQAATTGDGGDVRAAMAKTISTSEEDAMPATRPSDGSQRGMSENDVDKLRIDVAAKATTAQTVNTRLTGVSVWSRLLKRQFQRLELMGGDKIEIQYVDEIGPKGPQNVIRKDTVEVADDAEINFITRDGQERVTQVVLGGEVMLRVEDLDRDVSDKEDSITVVLAALPKLDIRSAELSEEIRPTTQATTQRSTPGLVETNSTAQALKTAPLVPSGMPSIKVVLKETAPHSGIFERVVKTSASAMEVDGKTLPLIPEGQLRAAYEDQKAIRFPDGWVVAKSVECIADAGGEALAVKYGQTYLDLQAKLKRAVAAGEVGKIYLDLGLVKRGKTYLASAQADCNEVAKLAAKTALGEEALYHSWRVYFYAGLLDEAVAAARNLMSAYPLSDYTPEAMFAIGQVSLDLGQKDVEQAVSEGRKPSMNKDLQRAISQLEEMVRRYPKSARAPEALYLVGEAKIAAGQTGLDVFERLAKQFADSAFAARGLSRAADYYVSIGDFRRAQEYFGRVLIDYPDSPQLGDITLHRGICQYKLGQMTEALSSFYKVAEEHPGTALAKDAQKYISSINKDRGAAHE
jgi:TolA-binding protein